MIIKPKTPVNTSNVTGISSVTLVGFQYIIGWHEKVEFVTKGNTWVTSLWFIIATQKTHDSNNWDFLGRQLLLSLKPQLFWASPRPNLSPTAIRRVRDVRPVTGCALQPRTGVTICSLSGPHAPVAEPWTQFEALPNKLLFRLKLLFFTPEPYK